MNISILTVFKELYTPFLDTSLVKLAQEKKLVSFDVFSFFSFVEPKKRIDAQTFGPGAGMLLKPEVVESGIISLEKKHGEAYKIFFSPHGKKLDQQLLKKINKKAKEKQHVMLIPARYEGMDARVEEYYADEIISVGDFVLMGGDLPAMMLIEGMLRLIPGVVGKQESVETDSFTGPFVDYPEYTEPVNWNGLKVPEIVRSGNHQAIASWRQNQAAKRTVKNHFDWMRTQHMTNEQQELAKKYIPNHYVVLMHDHVLVGPEKKIGTSSVMSIDIHDIARSSKTYGIKEYFIVTPLEDQQKIVSNFLSFWHGQKGENYNQKRHKALKSIVVKSSLDQVIQSIEQKEGDSPIIIATSAQEDPKGTKISFYDQEKVWSQEKPVLLLFGTANGLSGELISRCDYLLPPLHGLADFNHLSVRSAAAVVLDRWLGINEKD